MIQNLIPKYFSLLVLMLVSVSLPAQAYLYLEKEGDVPEHRWKQGEVISVLLSDGENTHWEEGYFNGGDSTGISLNTRFYTFEQILAVRYSRGLVPFLSSAFMGAAGLFTGVFATNAIINNERPILTDGQIAMGAGLLTVGVVMRFFRYRTHFMKEGYVFKVIDISTLE